jgi:type I restriction enzyme M protein
MDASQYKDYILRRLFTKYVSYKYAGKLVAVIDIPKGSSFADMATTIIISITYMGFGVQ